MDNSDRHYEMKTEDEEQWRIQGGPARWRPEKNFLPVY